MGFSPTSVGKEHQYKTLHQKDAELVVDEATGRMWQQGGSDLLMTYEEALACVKQKNKESFGGHNDWRLPTLLEAMALMNPIGTGESFLDSVFDRT